MFFIFVKLKLNNIFYSSSKNVLIYHKQFWILSLNFKYIYDVTLIFLINEVTASTKLKYKQKRIFLYFLFIFYF